MGSKRFLIPVLGLAILCIGLLVVGNATDRGGV